MYYLATSARTRRSPFTDRVEAAGVKGFTVYNHMLLPALFEDLAADCAHLKRAVQVWDVSVERQVELVGPDAAKLLQMTTPRDLARMADDQCYYVPLVGADGYMINDPVAVRLAEDRFWISIADTDALLYFKGLATGFGLNVSIFEPDVSPLAIQGPHADDLAAAVWGDAVRDLRFFRHMPVNVGGKQMILARSGWSKQGGFELYLDGSEYANGIWDQLFEAGAQWDVRSGGPNLIERIESGLMSFGNDIQMSDTPLHAGLGKFVHDVPGCLANDALKAMGPADRQIRAVEIAGDAVPSCMNAWAMSKDGAPVGEVRSAAFSPEFGTVVAVGMVDAVAWDAGTAVQVETPEGVRDATVRAGFWR